MILTSPIGVVDDLQKKGVAPLVVVIQVSEQTDNGSKETQTPSKQSKSALPQSQKTDTHSSDKQTPKHVTSRELFEIMDSAQSNKEED